MELELSIPSAHRSEGEGRSPPLLRPAMPQGRARGGPGRQALIPTRVCQLEEVLRYVTTKHGNRNQNKNQNKGKKYQSRI